MKLEEVAAVKFRGGGSCLKLEEVADVLRLEDASVQNFDDLLFKMKHFVGSTKADDYTTTNPAIGQLLRLLLFHFL